jgi:hypothetical protein
MAKSKNNVITFGLSGKTGDLIIFRRRDGQTIVTKVPHVSSKVSYNWIIRCSDLKNSRFRQRINEYLTIND